MALEHHILPARSGQTRSLVVLLHGFGANGAAILGLGKALSDSLPDTTFLAPDAPETAPSRPGARMWFTIPELDGSSAEEAEQRLQSSARQLDGYLDDQRTAFNLPANAIALLGFSQGAGMVYEVAPRRHDQLAGAIAIAGRMKRKQALAAEVRSRPPFLIMTGEQDHLMASEETQQTTAALSRAGIAAQHFIMPATGHGISKEGAAAASAFLQSIF